MRGSIGRMESGVGGLINMIRGVGISTGGTSNDGSGENLVQVIKALETAEAIIRDQAQENEHLKSELYTIKLRTTTEANGTLILCPDPLAGNVNPVGGQYIAHGTGTNGSLQPYPPEMAGANTVDISHPPSSTIRFMPEGDSVGSGSLWKQDLVPRIKERDWEIIQLRRHLADYTVKEAHIRNEKSVLEKKIAYMRMAFDQQQQDLLDAASKALTYRQDIIEENIRLTYALQTAEQERTIFMSSLVPLLAEYDLQPPVTDAQSIVGNLKILVQHLRERVNLSETKLKESQYQLTSNLKQQYLTSPAMVGEQIGIAQSTSRSRDEMNRDAQDGSLMISGMPQRLSQNDMGIHASPLSSPIAGSERDMDLKRLQNERDSSSGRAFEGSTGMAPVHDESPSPFPPYLPPVQEEPSSSSSEVAEDDPLPAVTNIQFSGESFPGSEIRACGFSINGTSTCNFAWVRESENGSVTHIMGANQPTYLITADDVDSRLAVEIIPMDNQKRKGELVREFANEKRKITCDPSMQQQIEGILKDSHASFEVSLSAGYIDIWEPAILNIKNQGYSIKCNEPRGVVCSEKFSDNVSITIPFGHTTEFLIQTSNNIELVLRAPDSSYLRDLIVLTMRFFQRRALQIKRKGKKKGIFF